MPLDFLQSVIRDAKTPAALQIKVAPAIIPYIRPKRSLRPKRPAVVSDRHGFAVDRELARKLRNKVARLSPLKRRRNPADQKLIMRLNLELVQITAALQCPCPSRYSMEHAKRDTQQLEWLWRKRRSRKKAQRDRGCHTGAYQCALYGFRLRTRNAGPRPVGRAERERTKVPPRVWSTFDLP
jgi:hypothetical protein